MYRLMCVDKLIFSSQRVVSVRWNINLKSVTFVFRSTYIRDWRKISNISKLIAVHCIIDWNEWIGKLFSLNFGNERFFFGSKSRIIYVSPVRNDHKSYKLPETLECLKKQIYATKIRKKIDSCPILKHFLMIFTTVYKTS